MSEVSVASKYGFNYFKIQDPANSLEIKPYQMELEKSRTEDMKSVIRSVSEIRSDLENLKSEVYNLKEDQTDYLKKQMYDLEERISHFKEAIKKELLMLLRDEINSSRDLQFIERRLEEWGKPINAKIFKQHKPNKHIISKTDENPTVEFQRFLISSGGHYGGWEEQDHLLFLRERKKFKGKDKFLSVVHCLLPDLSYEEIKEHEKWYQKYEVLKNSQKEAIQKWKTEKETQQKRKKEKIEGKEDRKKVKKKVGQQINIAERIKEWKNQQHLRKLEEEERLKKEKEKLKEEEKRKKEMQEIKKLAVSKYKAHKLCKTQQTFSCENEKLQIQASKARNNILLKSFRLQDLKFIEKKKVIRFQIESRANEKVEKLRITKPALELILHRDPQRIFQPTLIWSQHCLESQKREKVVPVFDLNSIPRLAIPEWRRALK